MKYLILAPFLSTLLLGAALYPQSSLAAATEASAAESYSARVIVRFKPAAPSVRAKIMSAQASKASAQDIAQTRATGLGLRTGVNKGVVGLQAHRSLDERTHVFTAKGISSAELVKRLALDSEVEMVVIDGRRRHTAVTPNDPLYAGFGGVAPSGVNGSANGQWYLKAPVGEVVSSINAPAAWDTSTGISSVVVAVLDTGVRKDHPDLAGQFVGGYDMIANDATAGDGVAGRDSDASDPGDYVTQADINGGALGTGCDATDIGNSSWHGTRVSGLIAASSNNGQGIAGVAWGVKILPIRVLGKCGGYDSDIMAGMKWAAGIAVPGLPTNPNPAKVLNLSLGGTGTCSATGSGTYRDTINQVIATGATIVVAAGNSEGQAVGLPGNCPGVITVTGLRHVGSKVGFSSVGPEVAIAAPGGNCVNLSGACLFPMLSTTNSGSTTPVAADAAYTNNGASVGTSFSAPIVAGTVALMVSAKPSLTSTEVLAILQRTARPFVSSGGTAGIAQCTAPTSAVQDECYCTTSTCGAGMLDAGAAVAATLVGATVQTISFAGPGNQILGSGAIALTASASSGLTVSFTSTTPSVCSVSGSTLSLLAAGNCSLTATQAGNATYAAASSVARSFTVSSSAGVTAQTITFAGPSNQTFGVSAFNLTASASSGLSVGFSSSTGSVCSVSGAVLTVLSAGTCTVSATQTGNNTYAPATPVTRNFTVAQAAQTITVASVATQTIGVAVPVLSASASSGLAVSFTSATPAVCSVSGSAVSLVTSGTCTLLANQAGNANYAAAAQVSSSFAVLPAAQTISFTGPADQVLGVAAPALSATASSGLAISFSSSTPSVCSVSGNSLSLLLVGTCTVSATQAGDSSFAAATPVSRSFAIAAAPVTVAESGGGGGGGAFSSLWVAMLGFSTWLLRRTRSKA
ncbi:S8 family peptidase [Paucibacter sp. B2R-40]|uniref:S8 family peptidase n=1 Tax=Paucibacter sp. B2R-40 TaxID=2893554 RepID=UPI0021E4E7D6|nr:S8 family peptidase [Paucibacter sp. B2R-40]MCV2353541.1 S8 family peptidase [Paucibacter sp. B2R-40]